MEYIVKLKKKLFTIVVVIFAIYVGLTLFADVEKFSKIIIEMDFSLIPLVLVLMSISVLFLSIRYHRLLKALNFKIPIRDSIQIYFLGLAFSVTPFSSGSLIKSHILKKEFNFEISKTFPLVLVEKWNELNSVLLLLFFVTIIYSLLESWIVISIGLVLSIGFIALAKNSLFFLIFEKFCKKIKFLKNIESQIKNSRDSFSISMNIRNSIEGLGLTTISKISESIAVFLIFESLNLNLEFGLSTQVYFVGVLSGFLSFVPGGLGIAEGTMIGLLTRIIDDFTLITAAVILVRLNTIWFATILGLIISKKFLK